MMLSGRDLFISNISVLPLTPRTTPTPPGSQGSPRFLLP